MKILVINWQDLKNPLSGGAEVHLHQFFSYFVYKGHSVTLLCSSFRGAEREDVQDVIRIIRRGHRQFFNFLVPFYLKQLLSTEDFDIIVEDVNKIPFFTRYFTKKPIVVITHHFFGRVIFQETNPLFGLYVYLSERLFYKLYRGLPIITVSESTREELVKNGMPEASISVVYNAVDVDFFKPGEKSALPFVLYLGRLKRYKRIDLFLKTVKIFREKYYSGHLRVEIVGDGDAKKELEKLVVELGLGDLVKFTGFVSEEEKARKLREAWLIVNTSPKEGWGIVVMEAQASGTPAIVFNSPGLREAVRHGETGFIVPFGEVENIAVLMRKLVEDRDLRERLSSNARMWAEKFRIDQLRKEFYETFLKQVSLR